MAILKIKDSAGVVTEIASIKGTSGKSPIIRDGYWWNYNDTTKEYENTNISIGNILTVSDTEPDTDLWIDTSVTEVEPITITINDEIVILTLEEYLPSCEVGDTVAFKAEVQDVKMGDIYLQSFPYC